MSITTEQRKTVNDCHITRKALSKNVARIFKKLDKADIIELCNYFGKPLHTADVMYAAGQNVDGKHGNYINDKPDIFARIAFRDLK